jgi:hypothetical protein
MLLAEAFRFLRAMKNLSTSMPIMLSMRSEFAATQRVMLGNAATKSTLEKQRDCQ